MTPRTDWTEVTPSRHDAGRVWRMLVAAQLGIAALIVVTLLLIFLMGALGSLFAQRGV